MAVILAQSQLINRRVRVHSTLRNNPQQVLMLAFTWSRGCSVEGTGVARRRVVVLVHTCSAA